MMKTKLGRLEQVSLRDVWTSEDGDFTPWLALPENLKLFGEAIGIDLELEAQEKQVGPFSLDLLCKDGNGQTVVIENQIESTDHCHLGQLLTYAAGLEAAYVVWIAKSFTDQHRAALDWLNEKANTTVRFFGVEIEAWRIGDSDPAPKFNIIAKPKVSSDRAKQEREGLNETEQFRIRFWTAFAAYLKSAGAAFQLNPVPNYLVRIKSPLQGFRCGFEISARDQYIDAWIFSDTEEKVASLRRIRQRHKKELDRDLGDTVEWKDNTEGGTFWIAVSRNADPSNPKEWPRQHQWMKEAMDKLVKEIGKYVGGLNLGSQSESIAGK